MPRLIRSKRLFCQSLGDPMTTNTPILRISFNTNERRTLEHARSLVGSIDWLDNALATGGLEFTPFNRTATAIEVGGLADNVLKTLSGPKSKTQRATLRYLSNLADRIASTSLILPTDLRSITRDSARCVTTVYVTSTDNLPRYAQTQWLVFGRAELRLDLQPVQLQAFLTRGATDFEHDSAKALVLPLVGVTLDSVTNHVTVLTGIVASRVPEDFRVPWPGYDPFQEALPCEADVCKDAPHPIVPEDFYVPPSNPFLYKEVEGRYVRITINCR